MHARLSAPRRPLAASPTSAVRPGRLTPVARARQGAADVDEIALPVDYAQVCGRERETREQESREGRGEARGESNFAAPFGEGRVQGGGGKGGRLGLHPSGTK